MHEIHELFSLFDEATDEQLVILAGQEHHLLTVFPEVLDLVRPRLSGAEGEILRSVGDEAVVSHLEDCLQTHGTPATWGEPLPSVVEYRDWHRSTAIRFPLPLVMGALSVMYGQRPDYEERFDALLFPYQARKDLIEYGVRASRDLTLKVWDQLAASLKEVVHHAEEVTRELA